uniref:Uncharacterized protein n=1 Tax=Bionectria ochroleuca TaxID=29856 RepID=A0A8H7TIT7_BIOOC
MTPTAMQNYNRGGYDFDDELFQGPPLHMNSQDGSRSRPHRYPSPVNTTASAFAIPSPIASPAFSDSFAFSGEPRSASQNSRRPPASKWDSMNGGFIPYPGNGPRPASNSNSNGPRSRPTTPAAFDAHNLIREPQSEPPSRPLTAKSSFSDMRGSDITSAPFENFSRPRKHSIRQPISDTPTRSRPALLPTPSEDGPEMMDYAPPWRPRGPSMCSNVSASTWAPGMSPTTAEFPDSRIPGTRLLKNAGPPPVSATRPQYGFGRTDSSGSAPILGGSVPWSGGEELRSSFRSQLTASTAPGTANTERSSVLTKNSSATSFGDNADAFVDPDEPSLEDVMGMYEQGFEDDIYEHSEPGDDQDEEFPPRPSSSFPQPEPDLGDSRVLDDPPDSPMLAKTRLDAEIRQSKMFFSSPAFMASVPHLASNLNSSNRFDETNRDSAKSLDTDPSDSSQPTVTSDDPTDRGLGISNNFASRDTSPSPAPTSVYDSRPSSPDPPLEIPATPKAVSHLMFPDPPNQRTPTLAIDTASRKRTNTSR